MSDRRKVDGSDAPVARTVEGFCAAYGVGRAHVYALLARGELEGRKVGKRTLILEESARRWFARLSEYGDAESSSSDKRLRRNGRFVKAES